MAKDCRWIWVADTHGDMICKSTEAALKEAVGRLKPDVRIHGGDVFDFRWLMKGAEEKEKREDIESDIEAGIQFLKWYKPTIVTCGNHDDRLIHGSKSDTGYIRGICKRVADEVTSASPKTSWVAYSVRVTYSLADTVFVHGFGTGQNAARKHAEVFGNVIMGHTHNIERVAVPRMGEWSTLATGRVGGCGCTLAMEYAKRSLRPLQWQNGFLWGTVRNGRLVVNQAAKCGEDWEGMP